MKIKQKNKLKNGVVASSTGVELRPLTVIPGLLQTRKVFLHTNNLHTLAQDLLELVALSIHYGILVSCYRTMSKKNKIEKKYNGIVV
ncbi:hypothetical protein Ddc_11603 [Ditylenchus destructor]|nr:hypothetical protein Ddc_11603 [Ditylenchus destructor]